MNGWVFLSYYYVQRYQYSFSLVCKHENIYVCWGIMSRLTEFALESRRLSHRRERSNASTSEPLV